jgi:hypothetical protein
MIDTEEYEGHSPQDEWTLRGIDGQNLVNFYSISDEEKATLTSYWLTCPATTANTRLIADVPLILQALIDEREEKRRFALYVEAEIKRLRDAIAAIANNIEAVELGYTSPYVVSDDLQLSEIFEDLRKVIE